MNIVTPAELAEHRADALERMESRAVIRRKIGKNAQNEVTGIATPLWAVVHADTPLRYVTAGADAAGGNRATDAGGVRARAGTGRADLPHDLDDLQDGDHIDITAGEWTGTVLKVIEAVKGDQRTARRVPIIEVPRPDEWES